MLFILFAWYISPTVPLLLDFFTFVAAPFCFKYPLSVIFVTSFTTGLSVLICSFTLQAALYAEFFSKSGLPPLERWLWLRSKLRLTPEYCGDFLCPFVLLKEEDRLSKPPCPGMEPLLVSEEALELDVVLSVSIWGLVLLYSSSLQSRPATGFPNEDLLCFFFFFFCFGMSQFSFWKKELQKIWKITLIYGPHVKLCSEYCHSPGQLAFISFC